MAGEHTPRGNPCDCGIAVTAHRPAHIPRLWPICTCGAYAASHRVKHPYRGDGPTCEKCGLIRERHLAPSPADSEYRLDYVGIDGEGVNRNPHKYILLCASAHDGRRWHIEDTNGLKTVHCLNWILETLDNCRVFSYGFGYDITMLLRDCPDDVLYRLLRPTLRYQRGKLKPVMWRGYSLNWLQGKLTIARKKQRVAIWDILKFFQQGFVKSLKEWDLITEAEAKVMQDMKDKRSRFRVSQLPKMRTYCYSECQKLAMLAQRLIKAHKDAGLTLKGYYGPGSTASVMLSKMRVLDYVKDPPPHMKRAIACAFFGGRFEHSFMGVVKPVYSYDISSAYPYHAYFLPCLKHGRWRHVANYVDRAISSCTTALVRYTYRGKPSDTWAPFPHRDAKGNICYPIRNRGWSWLPEIRAARGMGDLQLQEAWVYETDCSCQPFKLISEYYRQRSILGKDARGKVVKLAINSGSYGKIAQSKGPNPKYQNWIWAGLVTSGTRGQLLTAMSHARNQRDIIGVATDGVFSRRRLQLPGPRDTGTSDLAKALGGWEEKEHPHGILFLKPGIYLDLVSEEDLQAEGSETPYELIIKARGIGRKSIQEERRAIAEAFERGDTSYRIEVERFHGAKSSIGPKGRRPRFGSWTKMPIDIAFRCMNRREEDLGLLERNGESHPYDASLVTSEGLKAKLHRDISYEQP